MIHLLSTCCRATGQDSLGRPVADLHSGGQTWSTTEAVKADDKFSPRYRHFQEAVKCFYFFNIIESTLRYCSHNLVGHWILDANHLKDPHQTSDQQLWLGPCVCSLYCLSEGKSSKIMIQVHTINPYVQSICNTYTWIDYMTHPPPIKIYMRKKKKN